MAARTRRARYHFTDKHSCTCWVGTMPWCRGEWLLIWKSRNRWSEAASTGSPDVHLQPQKSYPKFSTRRFISCSWKGFGASVGVVCTCIWCEGCRWRTLEVLEILPAHLFALLLVRTAASLYVSVFLVLMWNWPNISNFFFSGLVVFWRSFNRHNLFSR